MSDKTIKLIPPEISSDVGTAVLDPGFTYSPESESVRSVSEKGKKTLHKPVQESIDPKAELALDTTIQNTTKKLGEGLKQTSKSTGNILRSFFRQIKTWYSEANSKEGKNTPAKKIITGVLSGGFLFSALISSFDFFSHLFTKNSKSNTLLKLGDTALKWVMGIGIFRSFTGAKKGFKFDNLNQALIGAGLSVATSQLAGVNEGKRNLMRTLSKASGVENTLQKVSGYTPLPSFSESMNSINPRGT